MRVLRSHVYRRSHASSASRSMRFGNVGRISIEKCCISSGLYSPAGQILALMRGMILAGGLSTRLYPLTSEVPKPLVPVLDVPVVDHIIDYLARHGVDDLVINVHYFAEAIESY